MLVLDGNEEFLVLGSDGLWNNITPEEVSETIYDELLETDGEWNKYNIHKDNLSSVPKRHVNAST